MADLCWRWNWIMSHESSSSSVPERLPRFCSLPTSKWIVLHEEKVDGQTDSVAVFSSGSTGNWWLQTRDVTWRDWRHLGDHTAAASSTVAFRRRMAKGVAYRTEGKGRSFESTLYFLASIQAAAAPLEWRELNKKYSSRHAGALEHWDHFFCVIHSPSHLPSALLSSTLAEEGNCSLLYVGGLSEIFIDSKQQGVLENSRRKRSIRRSVFFSLSKDSTKEFIM